MSSIFILVGLLILIILYFIITYNRFISLKQGVANAWGQIDIQLKRRYDLIPNLIESVKSYMKYEQDTLQKVIEARNRAMSADSIHEAASADQEVTLALKGVFALAESYPELKANQNMLSLQEELTSTENKIAFARQYYNDIVTTFNIKLQSFPDKFVGQLGSFKPAELFDIGEPEARNAIKFKMDL